MSNYLFTHLLPTDDEGGYLLVSGTSDSQGGDLYRMDTRYASATAGRLGRDDGIDLVEAATEPRPASAKEAKRHRKMATTHTGLAESGDGGPQQVRYMRQCAANQLYSAAIAETEQRWLPARVAAARNGTAVVSIVTEKDGGLCDAGGTVIVRHVDCASGEILLEENMPAISPDGLASIQHRQYSRKWALSRAGDRLLVEYVDWDDRANKMTYEEHGLQPGLPKLCSSKAMSFDRSGCVLSTDDFWFVLAPQDRGALIDQYEIGTLKRTGSLKMSRIPDDFVVSRDGQLAVCAMSRGTVWVINLETEKIRKFAPHPGAGKDSYTRVQFSRSKEFVVSQCEGQYVLTSLADGRSVAIAKARDTEHEIEAFEGIDTTVKIESVVSVLGDRIGIAEDREVRELSACIDDYEGSFVSEAGRKGARKPVRVTRKAPIAETLEKARLADHAETLLALRSPAAIVRSKKLGKRGWSQPDVAHAPELGASRLGGWPDLAEGTEWPKANGKPMAFLGQMNLAEANAAQPELKLPADGLLSFFLGCSEESCVPDGDTREQFLVDILQDRGPDDPLGWQVLYAGASASLKRIELDEGPFPQLFNPASLKFQAGGKLFPDQQSAAWAVPELTPAERTDYVEMIEQLQSDNPNQQLMGYPTLIQFTPPELYCEAGGFDFPAYPDTDEYREFAKKASEWTMLLKLDSDPNADFLWGDGGQFFFYIRRKDLEALDFSDTRIYFEN